MKNLGLDSVSFSTWLEKMDLVLLARIKDVSKDNYFLVQSNANGLIYTGSTTLQQFNLISFTAHLPLEKECPVVRKVNEECVNYQTEKTKCASIIEVKRSTTKFSGTAC